MKRDEDPVLPMLRAFSKAELARGLKDAWDVIWVLRTRFPEVQNLLQRDPDWHR